MCSLALTVKALILNIYLILTTISLYPLFKLWIHLNSTEFYSNPFLFFCFFFALRVQKLVGL